MYNKKIQELKKILYSKIDQLSNLIGDNFKTVYYDFFTINKSNLDEKLLHIREIFKSNDKNDLEVLVLKKDILKLNKELLKQDILSELEKEKKKLIRIRYFYIFSIFFFIIGAVFYYTNSIYKFSKSFNFTSKCNDKLLSGTGDNVLSGGGDIAVGTGDNVLSGGVILSGTGDSIGSGKRYINAKFLTGTFLLGEKKDLILSGNILSGTIIIQGVLNNKKIDISTLTKTGNYLDYKHFLIKLSGNNLVLSGTNNKFLGTFLVNGILTGGVIYADLLTGKIIKSDIKQLYKDENEEKLKGEKLKKYKEEKKIKCPYSGIIRVKVRALNLRKSNTQYSKRLGLLFRGERLQVLTCQKNLSANSWWYKVKVFKSGKIGWVSTVGVGK